MFSGCGGLDLGFTGGFTFRGHEYNRLNTTILFAKMLENSINAYHFPIEHRSNNKVVVIVIDSITPIEVKVGEVPALLLKISSYKTNLMDGAILKVTKKYISKRIIKLVVMVIMSYFTP